MSVIEPGPWCPLMGMPLMAAMSTALPLECSEMLPEVVIRLCPHSSARHRGLQARGGEELQGGEDAAVDRPGPDVALAAVVDVDSRIGDDPAGQRLLAHQQDLADRGVLGVGAEERVLAGGAVDRGRLEQLPAVEDRLGVDAGRAAAGRPDLEGQVGRHLGRGAPDAPEDRPRHHARARLQALEHHVIAVEAQGPADVGGEGAARGDARGEVAHLALAARLARRGAGRVGEQPLLGDLRGGVRGGRRSGRGRGRGRRRRGRRGGDLGRVGSGLRPGHDLGGGRGLLAAGGGGLVGRLLGLGELQLMGDLRLG